MAGFDQLSPQIVVEAVEAAFGLRLQTVVDPYPSYVNRVYGLTDVDGASFVVKFYRPDRWSRSAVEEEHAFTRELAEGDVPVVVPLDDIQGDSVGELILDTGLDEIHYRFALFPKRAGRLFDAETDEAWLRIGALCGRIHTVGAAGTSGNRPVISPSRSTLKQINELLSQGLIPPDLGDEFQNVAESAITLITPLFKDVPLIRLHGDLHRGNILDRGDEGLILIDLDDMTIGPAMQDLWLLLPGRYGEVSREIALMAEGYEEFRDFPWDQLQLIEPLRFIRLIHFIAWCARQRLDRDFFSHFPDWGSRSWWIQEIEDLRDQVSVIAEASR